MILCLNFKQLGVFFENILFFIVYPTRWGNKRKRITIFVYVYVRYVLQRPYPNPRHFRPHLMEQTIEIYLFLCIPIPKFFACGSTVERRAALHVHFNPFVRK